jgi:hypothetical protein
VEIPLLIRVLSEICGIHWSEYQTQSASLLSLSQAPRSKSSMASTWSELVDLSKASIKRTFDLFHSLAMKFMPSESSQSAFKFPNEKNSSHVTTALSYCTDIIDFLDTLLDRLPSPLSLFLFPLRVRSSESLGLKLLSLVMEIWVHQSSPLSYLAINFLVN